MQKVTVAALVIAIALLGVACSAETDAAPTPSKVIIIEPSGWDKAKKAFAEITGQTCAKQSEDFLLELDDIERRWTDALDLADNTSRINLNEPISQLQAIRRDLEKLDAPECAQEAQSFLYIHMEYVIDGFFMFATQEDDEDVSDKFSEAFEWFDKYTDEMSAIQE